MRIKALHLHGFKSFVDRTVFTFDEGITAVVGPNGCGKSNVVDAIRWVMGEQSPTRLRGKAMGDVIFGGAENRPAIGMAEITLTFDNSDGQAPPAFAAYGEIQINRRLYRSGESEYRLNNTPCRLRDVHDFFRDTGIGVKGYTIVEQGRVAEIVSARAEDRRILIEEAAGISKYKARRREAESKISSTEQNLTRVDDVLGEVRRQISSLERQARRASRYKRLQETQRILELSLAVDERRELENVVEREQGRLTELQGRVEQLENQDSRSELEIEERRIAVAESEKAASAGAESLYALRSQIKELEGSIDLARREREGIEESNRGRQQELETLTAQRQKAELDAGVARSELANLDDALAGERRGVETAESEARLAGEELRDLEGKREASNRALVEVLTSMARAEDRLSALDDRHVEVDQKLRSAEREIEVQQSLVAEADRDRTEIERGVHGLLSERDRVQELLLGALKREEKASAGLRDKLQRLQEVREKVEARRVRQQSLEEFIETREDVSEGNRHLLSQGEEAAGRFGLRGLVRDQLMPDREVERAVDSVLAERAEAIVVDRAASAVDALRALREQGAGRGLFLVEPSASPMSAGIVPMGEPLLDRVATRDGYESVARALLADVYLVETLQEPVDAFGASELPATFVTPEGDVLTPGGIVRSSVEAGSSGSLGRMRELRELVSEVTSLELQVRECEGAHREAEEELANINDELDNYRNRHHTAALAVANREKDLERSTERMKSLGDVHEGRIAERSDLFEATNTLVADREQLVVEVERLRTEQVTRQRESDGIVLRISAAGRERTRLESRVAELKVGYQGRVESRGRLQETLARSESALGETTEWMDRRDREILAATERDRSLAGEVEVAETGLAARLREEESARLESERLREAYDAQAQSVRVLENALREARSELHAAREEASTADLAVRESELRLSHQGDAIRDKWGVDLAHWKLPSLEEVSPELAAGEAGEAPAEEGADAGEASDEEEMASASELGELRRNAELARKPQAERTRELERVRNGLQSLGDVNLGAIEEHEELAERFRFLSEQKADLETTIQSLREAISRINRTSRRRFRETFEEVSRRFSENFPRLFGGGKASLELTEADDVLEAGVDIMAMPPGKRLQNVNLLSGGEKTMTALALLVAVFQVRPSPFFLLDEVDAALDDSNVGRFNQLIREMSSSSQFLIITHNKQTIEVADVLYGVTMEQKGVSKLVAVELN